MPTSPSFRVRITTPSWGSMLASASLVCRLKCGERHSPCHTPHRACQVSGQCSPHYVPLYLASVLSISDGHQLLLVTLRVEAFYPLLLRGGEQLPICAQQDVASFLLAGGDLESVGLIDVLSHYELPGRCQEFSCDRHYLNRAMPGHLEGLFRKVLDCGKIILVRETVLRLPPI